MKEGDAGSTSAALRRVTQALHELQEDLVSVRAELASARTEIRRLRRAGAVGEAARIQDLVASTRHWVARATGQGAMYASGPFTVRKVGRSWGLFRDGELIGDIHARACDAQLAAERERP